MELYQQLIFRHFGRSAAENDSPIFIESRMKIEGKAHDMKEYLKGIGRMPPVAYGSAQHKSTEPHGRFGALGYYSDIQPANQPGSKVLSRPAIAGGLR